jgi:hypothetical protein
VTLLAPAPAPSRTLTLRSVSPDTYVADIDGRFAGTIEIHGDHHYVRDGFGQYLGEYAALTVAQQRLTNHHQSR